MPRYVYVCDTPECETKLELIMTLKEKEARGVVQCPKCGVVMDQDFAGQGHSWKGGAPTPKFGSR